MLPRLRPARIEDLRRYVQGKGDPGWAPFFTDWIGHVAERDGELVGVGIVSEDAHGRIWVWVHSREALPAVMLHRTVRRMFMLLRLAGVRRVHAYRDGELDTSFRWLTRLGFRRAPEMDATAPRPMECWICDL